ncbi:hypothetical protein [Streptomyces aureocirculatus]|uniref:hypothetical protein n=1 Tax=Streptomyces aureocirculatus TaxID=67275 RepID=UPI000B24A235|nr:hypothetical protein [Streptomyces aureocirculatus]
MQQALNGRQQAVLDWVGQGCPDGVWPDSTYKVSVQALQNRGLVKITKRRGHWSAHLTDKGRQHLTERGTCPVEQNAEPPEQSSRKPAPSRPKAVPKAHTSYADQLLDELVANDGCLIKPIESGPHAVNWASQVSAARKSGKIPHTQELYGYRTHRGYEIKLVDIPAWRLAELTPVPVPARLTKPHPIVAALQKLPQPMGLTKPVQGRALRIIQALITATEAQGHKAARKRRADQQAREAEQQRWEAAMHEARAAYTHAYRVKHLGEQADAWHRAKRLTEYVTAVRDHATSLPPGQERTEIKAWLAFADAHLQRLTDSASAPKLPSPPKPSGDDLKPFLGHWSPYGPRSY